MKQFVSNKNMLNKIISFFIIIATLFMSVGYAAINSVSLNLDGELAIALQDGIFVSEWNYYSNSLANVDESTITSVDGSIINFDIVLSEENIDSFITYSITICNNEDYDFKFIGLEYDKEFYTNMNIVPVLDNRLKVDDVLLGNSCITFNLTFKYDDSINSTSNQMNKLKGIINLNFDYVDRILKTSDPIFDESGMIPVVIDNSGNVMTADLDTDWYSYGEKRWANMVLVSENSRDKYLEIENVAVSKSDILAYYVWVPRYSYKIWNTNASVSTSPRIIDVRFDNINTISLGTKVDEYRTMPAFWWDNDSDGVRENGEELAGIWVGKFETSKGSSSNVGSSMPVILPNSSSWVSQTLINQFKTILSFAGGSMNTSTGVVSFNGSSVYGLSNSTDSHVMKNSEWGAIAYLAHSNYGLGSQVRINNYYNSSSFLTGCGASSENQAASTTCGIKYGSSNSYPQSSTGNISGIFDMSGGAWDRVMGNYNKVKGSSEFNVFPESKYYDMFELTSLSSCTIEICGGHALFETSEWYSDLSNFISNNSYPWIVRSGGYGDGSEAGMFNFGRNVGQATGLSSMRAVLVFKE